ncbi:MAG: glutathione S-transferase family protein [Alphaproteobacteria bacterium]
MSGNCYKARLLLSLLGRDYERIAVDLRGRENRSPEHLRMNPRGQVPVLVDGEVTVWDSQAVIVCIARRYGSADWLPIEPTAMAEVMQWLAFSENEVLYGLARARAIEVFGRPWSMEEAQATGRAGLAVLESHLESHDWLALGRPTIADIACFPYVALAPEGGVGLDDCPAVRAWIGRIKSLPGYIGMPGIEPQSAFA